MAYRIEFLEDDDLDYVVPRMFEAMGNSREFINAVYPGHHTKTGQDKLALRFRAAKNASSKSRWTKAIDVASGEIVGLAAWSIIDEEKPPENELDGPPGTWSSDEEKKYSQALYRGFLVDRRRKIRESSLPIMLMNIMAVFIPHQRKGAGKMLTDWGLAIADEIQALCIAEATEAGQGLYQKSGFIVEREFYLDAREEYKDRPKDHVIFMVRPRSGEPKSETAAPGNAEH